MKTNTSRKKSGSMQITFMIASLVSLSLAQAANAASMECTLQHYDNHAEVISTDCEVLKSDAGSCVMYFFKDAKGNLAPFSVHTTVAQTGTLLFDVSGNQDYNFDHVGPSGTTTANEWFASYNATANHPDGSISVKCNSVADDILQNDIQAKKCTNFPINCL